MNIKSQIPNVFTLLNLLSGVLGIIAVLDGQVLSGIYFVLISAGFDFFDGFVARILKVPSEIGKQLDSLADLVSFGVLPGFLLYSMVEAGTGSSFLPYLTLIVPLLSAYRLAKFNIDTRQTDQFIGLPTPANALFISSLPHFIIAWPRTGEWIGSPIVLVFLAWMMAIMLIVELPLIALKFKSFSFAQNVFRYLLIILSLILIVPFGLAGIPLVILSYIGLSIIQNGNERISV